VTRIDIYKPIPRRASLEKIGSFARLCLCPFLVRTIRATACLEGLTFLWTALGLACFRHIRNTAAPTRTNVVIHGGNYSIRTQARQTCFYARSVVHPEMLIALIICITIFKLIIIQFIIVGA